MAYMKMQMEIEMEMEMEMEKKEKKENEKTIHFWRQVGYGVMRLIGGFLTVREVFHVLRLVSREFNHIFTHDLQIDDGVLLDQDKKKKAYHHVLTRYPTIRWRTGYCKGRLDQIQGLRFQRLVMYESRYKFQKKVDMKEEWGFDDFCQDQRLRGTAHDLNHLVLIGSYDVAQLPPLPYLHTLQLYRNDDIADKTLCPFNIQLSPDKFPSLDSVKLVIHHLDAKLVKQLKQMTQVKALTLVPMNLSSPALVYDLVRSLSRHLVTFYNFFTYREAKGYRSRLKELEWPQLEVLHVRIGFPLPRYDRKRGLTTLLLKCNNTWLHQVLETISGHVFEELVLDDLIVDLDYDARDSTTEWVAALNEAKCRKVQLCQDEIEPSIQENAAILYVWQKIFFHPKSNLEMISFGLNDLTITRQKNGNDTVIKFSASGSL